MKNLSAILSILCLQSSLAKEPGSHWAFEALRKPEIPAVENDAWVRTPVDAFILAALERAGIPPSPPAGRRTLMRRVSFTLTGLPPGYSEVEAFLADKTPDAFEKVVDRLLASPRYGERWGRHWLDVARYSDTKGYAYANEEFKFVHAWLYRDWVIAALNEDLPFEAFISRQLAADRLLARGACEKSDLAAMGFLTLGRRFLGVEQDIIDDRIDVTTRGLLGLTVTCARCHDHKYDPVPSTDYYALYAVFKSSHEYMVALKEEEDAELVKRRNALATAFAKSADQAEKRFLDRVGEYLVAALDIRRVPKPDFSEIISAKDLSPAQIRRWYEYLSASDKAAHPVFAPWVALQKLDPPFAGGAVAETLKPLAGLDDKVRQALVQSPPENMAEVAQRYAALLKEAAAQGENAEGWGALRAVLNGAGSPLVIPRKHVHDVEWLFDHKAKDPLKKLLANLERRILERGTASPHALILEDRAVPVNTRVLARGDYSQQGEEVPRRFLSRLGNKETTVFTDGSGRLELARAIVDPRNPLTARVMVNRIWQHHFGTGLVNTPSDFGLRCEPPSHPELLDFLAAYLIENNGSLKKVHRLIVSSSVYRQDSVGKPHAGDPDNRLLSRFPRRRLDFESMRDALLSASGELDLAMGGKPGDLFGGKATRRRAVYGFIDRQFLPDALPVFDFANPEFHGAVRHETSVPQRALFLLNSPFMVNRAKALAGRIEKETKGKELPEKIRRSYQVVFQREPGPDQVENSRRFLESAGIASKPPELQASSWQYGYGRFDEAGGSVNGFQELPHFNGMAWGGGKNWPDGKLGYVRLTAGGGHVGNDLAHAAVRRWVSPINGELSIRGALSTVEDCGDGVRAILISDRAGVRGTWKAKFGETIPIVIETMEVKKGERLDFLVDCGPKGNFSCDGFLWAPVIRHGDTEWNAATGFRGTVTVPAQLTAWERHAQALLISNEFMFVD